MTAVCRGAAAVFLGFLFVAHRLLTPVCPQLVTPFNVTVTELSTSSALISWVLDDESHDSNHTTDIGNSSVRLEIGYRLHHERQRMIIAVPPDVTSYILTDLRPGGIYTVRVTTVAKGHRIRSQPVRLFMSRPLLVGGSHHATSSVYPLESYPTVTTPPFLAVPPYSPILPPLMPPLPPFSSPPSGQYRNNRIVAHNSTADYRFPPTAHSAGVVYVRGEEVGIVVLVLIVWVAAVALFFHRWGKIRMLLPYQPVFKEEEPVIVGCSPSPTALVSQQAQLLPSSSLSQSQPPVPPSAVHVSANKFVSLDPAAVRRNQFMERRNWPASMSRLDHCIIVGRSPLPAARKKAYAGRRANTIAADTCVCCELPISTCRKQNDPNHHRYHHNRGRFPKFASGSGCSCEDAPRKAHSAEVITLTVTSCDSPPHSAASSSSSTPDLAERSDSPPSVSSTLKPLLSVDLIEEAATAECSL